jgi:cysteinyl-tRNA synthetase
MSAQIGKLSVDATIPLTGVPTTQTEKVSVDDVLKHIEQQIKARSDAKKNKNWALADQIRDELAGLGVILEDAPDGTTSFRLN